MCRMILAIGNIDMNILVDSIIDMSRDQTRDHELNKEEGRGSWMHQDGWGVAYLNENNEIKVTKSTEDISKDPKINEIRDIKTNLAILHIRKKMGSEVSIHNTHPFTHKEDDKNFAFCHNGFIDEDIHHDDRFEPKGETDSEKLFYSILSDLKREKFAKAIRKNFKRYNKLTGTNIILSSKDNSVIAIRDNHFPEYYRMQVGQKDDLVIVSSELIPTLNTLEWKPTKQGDVISIKHKTLKVKFH